MSNDLRERLETALRNTAFEAMDFCERPERQAKILETVATLREVLAKPHLLMDDAPRSATEETAIGHARYEYLRTLNPRKFAALYNEALMGVHQFDDLVDRYRDARGRRDG